LFSCLHLSKVTFDVTDMNREQAQTVRVLP